MWHAAGGSHNVWEDKAAADELEVFTVGVFTQMDNTIPPLSRGEGERGRAAVDPFPSRRRMVKVFLAISCRYDTKPPGSACRRSW